MQIILDQDEAWSLMTVATSFVIDHGGISQDGKQRLRAWRTARAENTPEMRDLTAGMNASLCAFMDEQSNRQIRQKGRFTRARSAK
jgi:hypothetical protein